jgi:hypothetical protein
MADSIRERDERRRIAEQIAPRAHEWFTCQFRSGFISKSPESLTESFVKRIETSKAMSRVLALGSDTTDRVLGALLNTYDDPAIPPNPGAPGPHWRRPGGWEEQVDALESLAGHLRAAAAAYRSIGKGSPTWMVHQGPARGGILIRDGLLGDPAERQLLANQLHKDAVRCDLEAIELRIGSMMMDFHIDGAPGAKRKISWDTPALLVLNGALRHTHKRWSMIEGLMTDFFDSKMTAGDLAVRVTKAKRRRKEGPKGARIAFDQELERLLLERDRLRDLLGLGALLPAPKTTSSKSDRPEDISQIDR